MIYPISEIFHSVQGEGRWTGTPMMFVRLAGCNVGVYGYPGLDNEMNKYSICTSFDGQKFLCDTDYHVKEKLTSLDIVDQLENEDHVCITGGEPFIHDLKELVQALELAGVGLIHIETSGTKKIQNFGAMTSGVWITCCPKGPMPLESDIFDKVSEWKVLVGPDFDEEKFRELDQKIPWSADEKYLQPINGVHNIWRDNMNKCLDLLKTYPHWKLSAQLHKYLEVR